jgi:hypothetical protein
MNRAIGVPFIRRRPARCAEFFAEIWGPPTNLFHPKECSWPPTAPANYRNYRSVAAPPRPIAGGRITLEQMVKLLTFLLTREVPFYPVSSLARKSLPSAAARQEPSSTPACLQVAEHGEQYHRARCGSRRNQPTPSAPTEPQAQRCTSGPAATPCDTATVATVLRRRSCRGDGFVSLALCDAATVAIV